jgi:2-polyprenyl-6-hydroxyphenyl methylase/3-demethylubiquinone-9 3-methyltransferase
VNKSSRHYSFGKNWLEYSQSINSIHVDHVTSDLSRLLNLKDLTQKSVLDIGCGSGVHDVGFYQLGCRNLTAIDYDQDCITATNQTLEKFCPGSGYKILQGDILSSKTQSLGKFDIVYSWGVLHHTGNLLEAICKASTLVAREGHLAIALYRKTLMCGFWKAEKRLYSRLPRIFQRFLELIYISFFSIALLFTQKTSITNYIESYSSKRGMNFFADVKDWLGGYPYESISPHELRKLMSSLGFRQVYSLEGNSRIGIFGSGCDEFLFQKK